MKEWKPTDLSLLAIDSQINWCVCSQAVTCRLFSLLKFKKKMDTYLPFLSSENPKVAENSLPTFHLWAQDESNI